MSIRDKQIPQSEHGLSEEVASDMNPQWLVFLRLFPFGFGHLMSALIISPSAPLLLQTLIPCGLPSHSIAALLMAEDQRWFYPRGSPLHKLCHSWSIFSHQSSALPLPQLYLCLLAGGKKITVYFTTCSSAVPEKEWYTHFEAGISISEMVRTPLKI